VLFWLQLLWQSSSKCAKIKKPASPPAAVTAKPAEVRAIRAVLLAGRAEYRCLKHNKESVKEGLRITR